MRAAKITAYQWAGLVVLSVVAIGCIPAQPLIVRSEYTAPIQRQGAIAPVAKNVSECRLSIRSLSDKRSDTSTFGTVTGRSVRSPQDVDRWLRSTFEGLNKWGVTVRDAAPLTMDAELLTAWVSDLPSSKNANIVMRVTYRRGDLAQEPKVYRGNESRMNWSANDGELQVLIDAALTRLIQSVSSDVQKACLES